MIRAGVVRGLFALCLLGAVGVADAAATGDLIQKPGDAGCFGVIGFCTPAIALDGAAEITVSPDGQSAFVASGGSDAVVAFDRAGGGRLIQKPGPAACLSDTGGGRCRDGTALDSPQSVAVSPDGKSAYVASQFSHAVAVFDRLRNGKLVQKPGTAGCISDTGAGPCVDGTALNGAGSVAVSPDGRSAYVASGSDAVAVFDRAANGTLAQKPGTAGCVGEGSVAAWAGRASTAPPRWRSAPMGKTPTLRQTSATPWRCSTANRAAPAAGHDESPRSDH